MDYRLLQIMLVSLLDFLFSSKLLEMDYTARSISSIHNSKLTKLQNTILPLFTIDYANYVIIAGSQLRTLYIDYNHSQRSFSTESAN